MSREMLLKQCQSLECIVSDTVELAEQMLAVSALLGKKENLSDILMLIAKLHYPPDLIIALRTYFVYKIRIFFVYFV